MFARHCVDALFEAEASQMPLPDLKCGAESLRGSAVVVARVAVADGSGVCLRTALRMVRDPKGHINWVGSLSNCATVSQDCNI